MGFSRQEYWTGLPCPPPGDLPNPRIEPRSPVLQILYQLCYLGNPMLMPLTTIKSKSVSFSCCSIAKSCLTLCDPMDCSIQCFPVLPCSSESPMLKFMSIESMMLPNYLILCHPFLLLPSIFFASGSFPLSQHFASGGHIGVSASASVLPMNIRVHFL